MKAYTYEVTYTDLFSGDPNYSWVNRYVIETDSVNQSVIMRLAKKAAGLTGLRGVTTSTDGGCLMKFKPYNMATVLFVQLVEKEDKNEN